MAGKFCRYSRRMGLLVVLMVICLCAGVAAGLAANDVGSSGEESLLVSNTLDEATGDLEARIGDDPSDTVGEPDLDVFLAERVVEPGTETTIELTIVNTGAVERGAMLDQETATARGVSIDIDDDDAPVSISTGDSGIGSIPPGEAVTVPLTVTAPTDADGDSGELDIELEYTYTEIDDGEASDETESDSFDVDIEVGDRPRFTVDDVDTDAQVGSDGLVEVDIENIGDEDADVARVSAQSPTSGVTIGTGEDANNGPEPETSTEGTDDDTGANGPGTNTENGDNAGGTADSSAAFIGELDSGDTETVVFDSRIDSGLEIETYLIELTVTYEDEDGILRESTTLAAAVEPTSAQLFELSAVDSSLEVGYSGTFGVELENTGPEDLDNPVVRATSGSDSIEITESQVALDELDEDDSTAVLFDADVSGQADPGDRQVTFTVEYGPDGSRQESDPFVRRVAVEPQTSEFELTAPDATVAADSTAQVTINVTNTRPEPLSDINVFLYPPDSLAVGDDEAFIPELDPGETETVTVEVTADGDAQPRTYPLEVDFRYDDERDDDQISEVYQLPVEVTETAGDGSWLPFFTATPGWAVILVSFGGLVGLGGFVWWRRNDD